MMVSACLRRGNDVQRRPLPEFRGRSRHSLGSCVRNQSKQEEARDLFAPVDGWFTEGFDTLDLKDAKALLDEPRNSKLPPS